MHLSKTPHRGVIFVDQTKLGMCSVGAPSQGIKEKPTDVDLNELYIFSAFRVRGMQAGEFYDRKSR